MRSSYLPLFCNKSSIFPSSPETHLKPSSPPPSSPLSSSPSSPFQLRLQFPKPPTGLSNSSSSSTPDSVQISSSGSSPTIWKRKRPARLDISVAALSFMVLATSTMAARDVVAEEREEYGYSVYCKRGRREAMRDWRVSASMGIH